MEAGEGELVSGGDSPDIGKGTGESLDSGRRATRTIPSPVGGAILSQMTKSTEDLVLLAKRLPPAERIALIEALLESMDATDPGRDAKWVAEAESRLEAYVAGELEAVDAEALMARLLR